MNTPMNDVFELIEQKIEKNKSAEKFFKDKGQLEQSDMSREVRYALENLLKELRGTISPFPHNAANKEKKLLKEYGEYCWKQGLKGASYMQVPEFLQTTDFTYENC